MRMTDNCEPDVITYSTVIDVLGRNERFDDMMQGFEEMREAGIEPNLVTYTSMIAGLTRASEIEEALQIMDDMERNGVQPNVYTFSSLINRASKRGDFESAMEILHLMREKVIWPSGITYMMLLQLALKMCKRAMMQLVFDEMRADGRVKKERLVRLEQYVSRINNGSVARNRATARRVGELVEECVGKEPQKSADGGIWTAAVYPCRPQEAQSWSL